MYTSVNILRIVYKLNLQALQFLIHEHMIRLIFDTYHPQQISKNSFTILSVEVNLMNFGLLSFFIAYELPLIKT